MSNLNKLTLTKAIELLDKKEVSIEEVYKDTLSSIEKCNKELNIYLAIEKDVVNKAKENKDKDLKGLPIAVKDNFLTIGLETTASSNVLKGFMPPYESTVTKKLKEKGGVIIGKTNMDAWAHGSSTETSDFGPTKNPRNPKYLPGGSSGGSAAAVAADMTIASIGSETAGSIRQPASWCGVVGLKPTYGRVSRYGVVAMGSSLDCPGPITKTVEDSAILLGAIAGRDKNDGTTSPRPVLDYIKNLKKGVKGLKVGVCYTDHKALRDSLAVKKTKEAAKKLEDLGASVDTILTSDQPEKNKILTHEYAIGVYTIVQRGEVSSNLSRYDGIRYGRDRNFFGKEAKNRVMLGVFGMSKNVGAGELVYVTAQKIRNLYIQNFKELFSKYDLLFSPSSPDYALPLGAVGNNPMFGELQDMLLEPSSLAGICGISVPMYRDDKTNLYLGLNIMADFFQEEKLLQAAYAFEQSTSWNSWVDR